MNILPLALLACIALHGETGGTLRLAIRSEPKTLDPLLVADEPSELVRYLTHAPLIRMNRPRQAPEPALAESWTISDAGRRVTLRLRRNVAFSDGSPFDAADVCHTFLRLPETNSPSAEPFHFAAGRLTCHAQGFTVILQFPAVLTGVERLFDAVPILSSRSSSKDRAGLGPFTIVENKAGAYIHLERNAHYWKRGADGRRLPYLHAVRLEMQRNRDLELIRFRRGELDLIHSLDAESFERLRAEAPGAVLNLGVSLDTEQLWFNQAPAAALPGYKKEWFRSTAFRLAVSDAIRRADMVSVVYRGHAAPAFGPVSPSNRNWVNAAARQPSAGPAAALARLEKAGFQKRGDILYDRAGNPVAFSLITNAGNKSRERLAAMVQQDLAAIGIRVTIAPLDFPSLIERIAKSFEYDACLLGLVFDDPDPNAQKNVWVSSAAQHQWNPSQKSPGTPWEAELDRLMQTVASSPDTGKRKQAFHRVQQIAAEQAPFVYLVHRNALAAVSPRLRHTEPAILRPQLLWNVEFLRIE
ncbi:MAG: ABC transporter substrate-binding protein [Bryobacterales bacterium]|nr:ABC transporter substrate-binding protein [Bryobacterales bacterium]